MTGFFHKSSRAFCTILIFLTAALFHVLFFSIFRPMGEKDARRSIKKRYTVMYQPDLHKDSDSLKLGYWFRLDAEASFAEPSFRAGFSGMVPPDGFREQNLLPHANSGKRKTAGVFFPVLPKRRSDELQEFSPFPPAGSTAAVPRKPCAQGVCRFTDWSGLSIPGWYPEKFTLGDTGNGIVFLSASSRNKLLPPDVRIEQSSGSPAFDRLAKEQLIRHLLKAPSSRKETSYFVFETGRRNAGDRKETRP